MRKKILLFAFLLSLMLMTLASCSLFGGSTAEKKQQLTEDMIFSSFVGQTYVYAGRPIEIDPYNLDVRVDGRYVSYELFEMTFSDNENVGTAKVTITAKPENPTVKGSVTVHFYIEADKNYYCKSTDDLAEVFASPNIDGVTMWINYTIPEDSTVIIPAGKSLLLQYGYRLENHGKIENYGTIKMTGAHLSTGGRRDSELENYGTIENHGTFTILDHAVIDDCGVFTSDNTISNAGTVYLRDQDKTFLENGQGGVRYVRKRLTAEHILVDGCVCKKGYYSYSPAVTLADCRDRDFTTEYFDNLGAGQGRVNVTMYPRAKDYYGEATALFTIEKGVAAASSLDELKTLANSGNFYEYQISSLTIPADDSFSLREGDTLTVGLALTVNGSFTNGGVITCDSASVGSSASFENSGSLATAKSIEVSGSFSNEPKGQLAVSGSVQVRTRGTFYNKAALAGERFFSIDGTVINEGSLEIGNAYVFGNLINRGTLTFPQGLTIFTSGTFVNEETGVATLSADSNFRYSFENRGTVVSEGRLSVADGCSFANTGNFDNQGGVWAFAPLPAVSGDVVIRKYLTDESVLFEADYNEITYDRSNHVPGFTVDSQVLPDDIYRMQLVYVGTDTPVQTCVAAGEVQMTITILPNYCAYAGTYKFTYTILHATTHVSSIYDFLDVYKDASYDNIILEEDLVLKSYGSYYVTKGCTFNLNGHKLILNEHATFSLHGSLVEGVSLPDIPSEEGVSILIAETAAFYNYGTLTNDGILLAKGGANFQGNAKPYLSDVKGSIVNNGVIYTNDLYALNVTGEGAVYRRTLATVLSDTIEMPVVEYDGTLRTPLPEAIYYKNRSIAVDRFLYEYDESQNVNAGDLALIRLIVANVLDPDFYGKLNKNFTIRRGATQVGTSQEFLTAVSNVNYDRIRLTNNLLLTQEVTLADGQCVDLSSYELSFSENGKLIYGKNCRLLLTAGTEERFLKYAYLADEITLSANIGVAGSATELTFTDYTVANITGGNYLSTVVHAEGYSFLGGLIIENDVKENFAFTFENSSENESTIGCAVPTARGQYALYYRSCREETYVTLKNFTVYGAYLGGGTGTAQEVNLTAENCRFLTDPALTHSYAFQVSSTMTAVGNFTECTFEGANAFRANQGTLTFDTCVLRSYDAYSNTYNNHYGDTMFLAYSGRHGMHVTVTGCSLYSVYGNGIHLHNANNAVTLSVDSATSYTGTLVRVVSSAD